MRRSATQKVAVDIDIKEGEAEDGDGDGDGDGDCGEGDGDGDIDDSDGDNGRTSDLSDDACGRATTSTVTGSNAPNLPGRHSHSCAAAAALR